MSAENVDQEFHPIELFRKMIELVNVGERIALAMEHEDERRTAGGVTGLSVNDLLFSGAVKLPSTDYHVDFTYASNFAAVVVDDANSIGDLLVVSGSSSAESESIGAGRWRVAKGTRRVCPLTGSSFSITSLTPTAGVLYLAVYTINRDIV